MAIVDWAYYTGVYLGQEAGESEFPALEARAEDVIGAMTHWAVKADTIAGFSAFTQELVKKAICAQTDFFAVNGLDSISFAGGQETGFTVGKVSVKGRSGASVKASGTMADSIAPLALLYLEQSGLMNPAVPVAPDVPLIGGWFPC